MKLGIIGNGFVGKATQFLKSSIVDTLYVYDIVPEKCTPVGLTFDKLAECDLIFIALPTPMLPNGCCYLDTIKQCIGDLNSITNPAFTSIILRSTVPPGTSEELGVYFMPEFLTERNWMNDFVNCKHWIFGCDPNDNVFIEKITKLFNQAQSEGILKYNNLHFTTRKEAELVKYVRNSFLAMKVSFFNEIYDLSQKLGIDFESVRKLSTLDDRIGPSHSNVPGPDGLRGYGGTCLPKDVHNLLNEMCNVEVDSHIVRAIIERNEKVDRMQKDWLYDNGRVILFK